MMRFCTSRSLNTRITSARLSESPTNSICVIDACWRARQRHDAGQARDVRQQLRRGRDQRLGVIARRIELAAQLGERRIVLDGRARLEQ